MSCDLSRGCIHSCNYRRSRHLCWYRSADNQRSPTDTHQYLQQEIYIAMERRSSSAPSIQYIQGHGTSELHCMTLVLPLCQSFCGIIVFKDSTAKSSRAHISIKNTISRENCNYNTTRPTLQCLSSTTFPLLNIQLENKG